MCFGSCRVTCDNCKPKFVYCPTCGHKCMLFHKKCKKCGAELTDEMKQAARDEWQVRAQARHDAEVAGQNAKRGTVDCAKKPASD